jgi:mutator protein MutT
MTDIYPRPKLGAIAVVVRDGRVLLVERAKAPNAGTWGFPGGHVEWGETALEAAVRELAEETGVIATSPEYLTNLDVIAQDETGVVQYHYLLAVVLCAYVAGEPVAADDASDARWFTPEETQALEQAPRLQDVIALLDI